MVNTTKSLRLITCLFAILLITSSAIAIFEYNSVESLRSEINQREREITHLQANLKDARQLLAIKPVCPQYLSRHYYSSKNGSAVSEETKLFLLSATPNYDFWQFNDTPIGYPPGGPYSYVMRKGDPIFTINVTVRNDYTPDESNSSDPNAPIGDLRNGKYGSFIILTASLYSQNGSVIRAVNVNQPLTTMNGYEFILESGQTENFVMLLSTPNRDIDHYEIYAVYLKSQPQP